MHMEKSRFDMKTDQADAITLQPFDRVYVGEEFCDTYFIKHSARIRERVVCLSEMEKPVTIVLPVLNEVNFGRIVAFLDSIQSYFTSSTEVVCNDLGTMSVLAKKGLNIVSGRYLTRLAMGIFTKPSEEFQNHPLACVQRVEIDALSLKYVEKLNCPNISFYENYLSYCLMNNRCPYRQISGVYPEKFLCTAGCEAGSSIIRNKYSEQDFILYRNTILQNKVFGENLTRVNRIIYTSI